MFCDSTVKSPARPKTATPEAALAERARRGDRGAFGTLYERFAPAVHGVLLGLVNTQEAKDLVHDVFAHALDRIDQLESPDRFGAWICSIARRSALNARRARRPSDVLPDDVAAPSVSGTDERDQAEAVLAVLRTLPDAYREPLVMRLVEGLTGPEIAERTGMTHGSVRVNLTRGMQRLRDALTRRGTVLVANGRPVKAPRADGGRS